MAELSVMKRRSVIRFFSGPHLTNKEALIVLCSVVKHFGRSRARKKCRGKHETQSIPANSHACGLKTSISRRLTPAGQFLTPD